MAVIGVLDTLFLQRFNQHIKKPGTKSRALCTLLIYYRKKRISLYLGNSQ